LRVRPRRVPRELDLLPGREVREDLVLQLAGALLEQLDLRPQLGRAAAHAHELLDLPFELDDGALEVESGDLGDGGACGGVGHGKGAYLNAARMRAANSSRSASVA